MSKNTRPPWHADGMLVKDSLNRVVAVVRLEDHEAVIAEAPRVLDALETMVAVFDFPEEWSHPDMEDAVRVARAAIAAARGETP